MYCCPWSLTIALKYWKGEHFIHSLIKTLQRCWKALILRAGHFALFLHPHPGAFRQFMCPHPKEFAHLKNANAWGLAWWGGCALMKLTDALLHPQKTPLLNGHNSICKYFFECNPTRYFYVWKLSMIYTPLGETMSILDLFSPCSCILMSFPESLWLQMN